MTYSIIPGSPQSQCPAADCWDCRLYCRHHHLPPRYSQGRELTIYQPQVWQCWCHDNVRSDSKLRERAGQGGGARACSVLWVRWPGGRESLPCTGSSIMNGDMLENHTELFRGLVPGLQRQMAFSAIRIGLYENFKRWKSIVFILFQ